MTMTREVNTDHRTAEILRLERGLEGCGCAECQEFYRTIDLSVYGKRVKSYAGVIIITEKGKEKEKKTPPPSVPPFLTHHNPQISCFINTPDGFDMGVPPKPKKSHHKKSGVCLKRGRPQKIGKELSRTTLWRRRREILKKQERMI